ncbi:Leucine-rich repeat protein SHOC-2 [Tetrabaena socialis]|uniref:Leucine-rich repeat protein SHOC-2 n=1 Tax=Tetrabaena socialis TaxID=47790 RepID=A0A2J8AFA8_9CHLO|nr:Leucine-rich repeat protein SHOC-2 [Tetrabaena socialis]|eukprot:PNH11205.1 Leucine-rich repeat protein SHOC-2 [Tetrabaena socialis]
MASELVREGLGLAGVPAEVLQQLTIVALKLARNNITAIPVNLFPKLQQLEVLDLSSNKLVSVPNDLGRCSKLKVLLLGSNSLSAVPEGVFALAGLTRLELQNNKLVDASGAWIQLTALKAVYVADVRHNGWRSVPAEVLRSNGLVVLNASDNDIEALADGITPQHMGVLNLSFNRLASLPAALGAAPVLQQMYLANNRLTDLPRTFACLPMVDLFLSENLFEAVPVAVLGMSQLAKLSMAACRLAEVPDALGGVATLNPAPARSTASGSGTTAAAAAAAAGVGLPDWLSSFRSLATVVLDHNGLGALPGVLTKLPRLSILMASGNAISGLQAEQLGALSKLQALVLQSNLIPELPPTISRLTDLKALSLAHNRLARLPDALTCCSALRLLDASSNQLVSLPSGLAALSKLKVLKLASNCLPTVPRGLSCLGALTELMLASNPLPLQGMDLNAASAPAVRQMVSALLDACAALPAAAHAAEVEAAAAALAALAAASKATQEAEAASAAAAEAEADAATAAAAAEAEEEAAALVADVAALRDEEEAIVCARCERQYTATVWVFEMPLVQA